MSAQQELISAVRSMQANAQANLPVIPNNGNPNGAYNAPRAVAAQPQAPMAKPNPFSWLEPSPAMQQLQATMAQRQQYLNAALGQIRQQPAPPLAEPVTPVQWMPQRQVPPVIPMTPMNPGVVLPNSGVNTGIIPPHMQQSNMVLPQPRMI